MRAIVKVRRSSCSVVVTLTAQVLAASGLKEGDRVIITVEEPGKLTLNKEESNGTVHT